MGFNSAFKGLIESQKRGLLKWYVIFFQTFPLPICIALNGVDVSSLQIETQTRSRIIKGRRRTGGVPEQSAEEHTSS